jgi:sortase (surface protein transpeptidase)
MHSSQTKTWISFLLVAAGAVLLFLGAREFLGSHFGQMEARNSFGRSTPAKTNLPAPKQGDTVARLYIPRLDAEIYIVEGDGPWELRA